MALSDAIRKIKQLLENENNQKYLKTAAPAAAATAASGFPGFEILKSGITPPAYRPPEPEPEYDLSDEVVGAVGRIPYYMASQMSDMAGFVTGVEAFPKVSENIIQEAHNAFPSNAPKLSTDADFNSASLSDFAKYALAESGQVAASIGSIALPGIGANKLLLPLFGKIAKYSPRIAKVINKLGGVEKAAQYASANVSGTLLEGGAITGDTFRETGEMPEALRVLPWAMTAGALESLEPLRLLTRFSSKVPLAVAEEAAKRGLGRRLVSFVLDYAKDMGLEGGTEWAQTLIEESAVKNVTGKAGVVEALTSTYNDPDAQARAKAAGISGATGAGGMRSLVDVVKSLRTNKSVPAEPSVATVPENSTDPIEQVKKVIGKMPEAPPPQQETLPEIVTIDETPGFDQTEKVAPVKPVEGGKADIGGNANPEEIKSVRFREQVSSIWEGIGLNREDMDNLSSEMFQGKKFNDLTMPELQQLHQVGIEQAAHGNVIEPTVQPTQPTDQPTVQPTQPAVAPQNLEQAISRIQQPQATVPQMPITQRPENLQQAIAKTQNPMPVMRPAEAPQMNQPRQPMQITQPAINPPDAQKQETLAPENISPKRAELINDEIPTEKYKPYRIVVNTKNGPVQKIAIRENMEHAKGMGDALFDSEEKANEYSRIIQDRDKANQEYDRKNKEREALEQEKKNIEIADLKAIRDKSPIIIDNDYINNLPQLQRGRINLALDTRVTHKGRPRTWRGIIESGEYTNKVGPIIEKETGKPRYYLETADGQMLKISKILFDSIKFNDAVINEMAKADADKELASLGNEPVITDEDEKALFGGKAKPAAPWLEKSETQDQFETRMKFSERMAELDTAEKIQTKIDSLSRFKDPTILGTVDYLERKKAAMSPATPAETPQEKPDVTKTAYGANNTIVTTARYNELLKRFKDKTKNITSGVDPELAIITTELAVYHMESGVRKFADFAKKIIADAGETFRPFLAQAYMSAKFYPGSEKYRVEMDTETTVNEWLAGNKDGVKADKPKKSRVVSQSAGLKTTVVLNSDGTIESRYTYTDKAKASFTKTLSVHGTFTMSQNGHKFSNEDAEAAFDLAAQMEEADNGATTENANTNYREKVKPFEDKLRALIDKTVSKTDETVIETDETVIETDETVSKPNIGKAGDIDIPALSDALMPTVESWLVNPMSDAQLKKIISDLGIDTKDIKYSHKLTQEAIEGAIVRVIRKRGLNSDQVLKMYQNQPALDERTVTSIMNQAYSTPAPLSMMLIDAIGFDQAAGSVYEPTAGNGLLLSGIRENEEGTLHDYRLNELEKNRNDQLKSLFPAARITNQDALDITPERKVDLVMTNPPFGSLKGIGKEPFKIMTSGEVETEFVFTKLDHAIAAKALQSMKDNGKAVVILGAELDKTDKAKSEITGQNARFMDYLYNQYNITGHFELSGDLYKKQGAAWPVIVLTIEGRKSFPRNYAKSPKSVERAVTWNEVKTAIAKIEPGKYLTGEPRPSVPGRKTSQQEGDTGRAEVPNSTISPTKPEGRPKPTSLSGAISAATGNKSETKPIRDSRSDNKQTGDRIPAKPETPEAPIQSGREAGPVSDAEAARQASIAAGVVDTDLQSVHEPESKKLSIGALVPANLKNPMQRAMKALVQKIKEGSVDEYVAHQLGYDNAAQMGNMLSAQQVDALGLAFYNFLNDKATIIADQTGVGKGRVAAAAIAWAVKNGYIPVFTTETAGLFNDIYRDLKNIKESGLVPFIMNADASMSDADGNIIYEFDKKKAEKVIRHMEAGDFSDFGPNGEYDYIAMTYSQVNTEGSRKINALLKAPRGKVITILDESHNAAGTDSNQGENIAKLIDSEVSKGVMYLSATWSKTPDQMAIYHRAFGEGMSIDEINIAFQRGGVAMQEMTVASMADKGAYVRREQSFANVEFTRKKTTAPREIASETEKAEKAMAIVRDILDVGGLANVSAGSIDIQSGDIAAAFGDELDDKGNAVTASIDKPDSPFSQVHNYVGSFLTSLKADAAAEAAIEDIKKGIKPVIVIQNTMGSAIDQLIETGSAKIGEGFGGTFADALDMMLEKTLIMPVKNNFTGKKSSVKIPLESMPPAFQAAFKALKAKIKKTEFQNMPFSPIDYIANKIKQAGYSMGELTGRDKYLDYGDLKDGKPTLKMKEIGNQAEYRKNTINEFNNGTTDAFLFNVAGATGMSIHSSVEFKDQRQREMFILQPFGDINKFMQAIGRTHRVGEVVTEDAVTNRIEGIPALFGYPSYKYLQSSLGMEIRSGIALEKKMKSLNAQTSSNEKGHQSVADVDVMNKYGLAIMRDWLDARPLIKAFLDLDNNSTVEQITGRIAVLKQEEQEQFWQEVVKEYQARIQQLDAAGENDLVATSYSDSNAKTLSKKLIYGQEGSLTSPPIYLEHMEMTMTGKPTSLEGARQRVEKGASISKEQIEQRDKYLKDYLDKKREDNAEAIANGKDPSFNISTIQAHADGVKEDIADLVPGTIVSNDKGVGIITDVYLDDFVEGSSSFPWNPSAINIKIATPGTSGNLIFSLAAYRKDGYRDNGLLSDARKSWIEDYEQEFNKNSTKRVKRYLLTGDLYRAATMSPGATAVKFQRDNGTFDFGWMQGGTIGDDAILGKIKEPPVKLTEDDIKNRTPERVRSSDLDGVDIRPAVKVIELGDGSTRYETIYAEDGTPGFWFEIRKTNKKYAKALYSNKELLSLIKTGPQSDGLTEVVLGGKKYLQSAPLSQKLKAKVMLKVNEIVKSRGGALVDAKRNDINTGDTSPTGISSSRSGHAGILEIFAEWTADKAVDILESAYNFIRRGSGSLIEWIKTLSEKARKLASKAWKDARKLFDLSGGKGASKRGGTMTLTELIKSSQETLAMVTKEGAEPISRGVAEEITTEYSTTAYELGESKAIATANKKKESQKKRTEKRISGIKKKLATLRKANTLNYEAKKWLVGLSGKLPGKERSTLVRAIATATTPKQIGDVLNRIDDLYAKVIRRASLRRFADAVRGARKLRPEFQEIANGIKGTLAKKRLVLESIDGILDYLEENDTALIPEDAITMLKTLQANRPKSISPETMDVISQILESIRHMSDQENRQIFAENTKTLKGAVVQIKKDVELEDKITVGEDGKMDKLKWFFDIGSMQYEAITEMLGEVGRKLFYGDMREGERNALDIWFAGRDEVHRVMTEIGLKPDDVQTTKWLEEKKKVSGVEMTRDEFMNLVASLKDPSTRREIIRAGFKLKSNKQETIKITSDGIDALIASATKQEMKVIDAMRGFVNGRLKNEINKTWVFLAGFEKALKLDYWPRTRDIQKSGANTGFKQWAKTALEELGIFKERRTSKAAVVIGNATDVYQNHLKKSATFAGMAIPIRNIEMAMGKGGLADAMEARFGKQFVTRLEEQIQAVADLGHPGTGPVNEILSGLLQRVSVGYLGFNVRSALKQFGGLFTAATEISGSLLASSIDASFDKKVTDEMYKYSSILRNRYDSTGAKLAGPEFDSKQKIAGNKEVWTRRAMKLLETFDRAVSQIIWTAAKKEIKAAKPGLSNAELMAEVARRAELIVSRTQNVTSILDMSGVGIESRKNSFIKAVAMFQSQGNSIYNIIRRSIRNFRKGKIGATEMLQTLTLATMGNAIWSSMVGNLVSGNVISALMRGGGDDDDKEKITKYFNASETAWDIAQENFNMFYGGSMLSPFIRNMRRIINEDKVFIPSGKIENATESVINNSLQGLQHVLTALLKEDEKIKRGPNKGKSKSAGELEKGVVKLMRGLLPATGVPTFPFSEGYKLLYSE